MITTINEYRKILESIDDILSMALDNAKILNKWYTNEISTQEAYDLLFENGEKIKHHSYGDDNPYQEKLDELLTYTDTKDSIKSSNSIWEYFTDIDNDDLHILPNYDEILEIIKELYSLTLDDMNH